MGLIDLHVYSRDTTGKNANRRSRVEGRIPAVLYGHDRETEVIALNGPEFSKAMSTLGGRSVIFALKQQDGDEDAIALLREVQRHPVSDAVLHVDLLEIPRGVPITVPIPVSVIGESAAIKRGDANLALICDSIDVSCLPRELPESATADITGLEVNDRLLVKDLSLDTGEIVTDQETLVLLLRAPIIFVEEEEVAEGEGVEGEEGEAAEGEKAEGEKKEADSGEKKDDK